ncbi:Uncharacterized protein TCM_043714 [Theobroma cacao]|uniref:Endonuclease/exonuclease/phosphatase domain-containing protein n=1 Tax=Theobroma cacao TaxID=3641 RepID=A0A061FW60_THECC|nr:Uncharacterized protein TCM_043714 [Theobroma cacao]
MQLYEFNDKTYSTLSNDSWMPFYLRTSLDHYNITFRCPWLCVGDFNEIFYESEKIGGTDRNESSMRAFRETCTDCVLRDLGYRGPRFTWWNNRDEEARIRCRLDRAMATQDWSAKFPRMVVFTESLGALDHLVLRSIPLKDVQDRIKEKQKELQDAYVEEVSLLANQRIKVLQKEVQRLAREKELVLAHIQPCITVDMNEVLAADITLEEVRLVLF